MKNTTATGGIDGTSAPLEFNAGTTAPAPAETRFDEATFADLEEMVGEDLFQTIVEKFDLELKRRFADLSSPLDPQRLGGDAHAVLPSAATLGFNRLAAICRRLEESRSRPVARDPLLDELVAELRLVADDLGRRGVRRSS